MEQSKIVLEDGDYFVSDRERQETEKLINGPGVSGYAIFDKHGVANEQLGVSDTTIAVFSTIFDVSEQIGTELGERDPRPAMMFSSKLMELMALPMTNVNVLVVKDKTAKPKKDFANAG